MNLKLSKSRLLSNQSVVITGSKSESNRLLMLQALYPNLELDNLSNSDDTQLMLNALITDEDVIDIHHAGTAMRFLTAYFAFFTDKEIILTGSERMKERPIGILVDALRLLGADIHYKENIGFPPLKIRPVENFSNKTKLKANVSSQYISALILSAPKLSDGLDIELEGKLTSRPYLEMTLALLNDIGIETSFEDNNISIKHKGIVGDATLVVESDWSSASYFYSLVALSDLGTEIKLSSYKSNSLQGDSTLVGIYKAFGVETKLEDNSIVLTKSSVVDNKSKIEFDLRNAPDIAQTIAATAFGMGLECELTGLHTLKIKETDRLVALKNELEKLGATISITQESLYLEASTFINSDVEIETYNDHRMAMAFAPLALKTDLVIKDSMVVSKSYPDFWEDLKTLDIHIA